MNETAPVSVHPIKERKGWIDFLRGIAMLLVIWGHVAKGSNYYVFSVLTNPLKIPLFFAISGYVFNYRDGKPGPFLKNLFFKIIVPWIVLSLVWVKPLYALFTGHPNRIPAYFYSFISGGTLWFMPACVIAEILFFAVQKAFRDVKWRYLAMALIAALGLGMSLLGVGRFAMLDVACIAQLFILFGYWFRLNEESIRTRVNNRVLVGMLVFYCCLAGLSAWLYPGRLMDVHNNRYYNYLICGLMIGVSLMIAFVGSAKIKMLPSWIVFVGQNTLVFYILHYYARRVYAKGLSLAHLSLPGGIVSHLAEFLFVCVSMSVCAMLINRFFPFAVGKKRLKR